jgi:site-specific recombinase XerD
MSQDTWSRKKKDDAPRGLFRHGGGGWAIRYTCGVGHIHEEKVGPIKGDALRAHAARRTRCYAEPGWCPARERTQAREQAQAAAAQVASRMRFRQYAEEFYLPWALLKRRRSYKTIRTEVTWLVSVLGEHWLSTITPTQLERVLDDLQRGLSPSGRSLSGAAVNRYRARLSGMFKRAMKRGLVERNPIAGTEKEPEPGGRIVYLPAETPARAAVEEQAIRDALPAVLRPLFTVSVHTGLRWSEQRALQWRDVDLLAGFLTVRHAKNGRSRQVPMNSVVQSVLLEVAMHRQRPEDPHELVFPCPHREPDKFFPAAVEQARRTLATAGQDAGHLEGYTWHGNRHTFASRLVMAGVDLRTVQQLGGWQSLAMVQRYSHLAPDHLRAAVERLVSSSDRMALGQNLDSVGVDAEVDRRGDVQDTDSITRRGGRARLKASDSKSDRGASPSGVQILSPPPI